MISVMILEDDIKSSNILEEYILKYSKETNQKINIKSFSNAEIFIKNCNDNTDILFMDIEMPGMGGMEAAKIIREKNKSVIIVFVTNLAQYAINGYEVQAYDFILKPVRYPSFVMKLNRICNQLNHTKNDDTISITYKGEVIKLFINDILYIEIQNHNVIIHTFLENIKIRSTLQYFIDILHDKHFVLCNSCYLINLKNMKKIEKNIIYIGEDEIMISQPKRKNFLQEVAKYLGGSI